MPLYPDEYEGLPPNTRDRDLAFRLAQDRNTEAEAIAMQIPDPWFRCQALAAVASAVPNGDRFDRLLHLAFTASLETAQPNRICSVATWPLQALAMRGLHDRVALEIDRLLPILLSEPSPVRRADALDGLLRVAVRSTDHSRFWSLIAELCACSRAPLMNGKPNKRGESRLGAWIPMIQQFNESEALRLVDFLPRASERETALQRLANKALGRFWLQILSVPPLPGLAPNASSDAHTT